MKSRLLIPRFFIIGVKDFAYTQELDTFLNEYPVSGLALFNSPFDHPSNIWKNPDAALEQVYEFSLKALRKVPFLSVDQEGGRVRRLRKPFIELPSAEKVSMSYKESRNERAVYDLYYYAAKQMNLLGLSLNFAPVCDIRYPESSQVIGDRSYGSSREEALELIRIFCLAFKDAQVHTTLKHFPGHGPSKYDSHERAASLFKSRKELFEYDRKVFVEASPWASAIMTAHISFEESPEEIFSLDKASIEYFKQGLPQDLAWITDDLLSMKSVSTLQPWLKALELGYDYLLLCGDLDQAARALDESIRLSETWSLTFDQEEALEKKAQKSFERFKFQNQLEAFKTWKSLILELEKKAHESLIQLKLT